MNDSQLERNEIEVAWLPPDEGGITDEGLDMSGDEATGTFIHLPRGNLNVEAETSTGTTAAASKEKKESAKELG